MNYKRIIFSAIITSLIGAFFGLLTGELAKNRAGNYNFQSKVYQTIYKRDVIIVGALIGCVAGIAQECVRELKNERDAELDAEDEKKL